LKLLERPAALGYADDGNIERAALHHRVQRREYFLIREIARSAEEHQCIAKLITRRIAVLFQSLFRRLLSVAAESLKQKR